jgi:hypothetical protein
MYKQLMQENRLENLNGKVAINQSKGWSHSFSNLVLELSKLKFYVKKIVVLKSNQRIFRQEKLERNK